MPENPNRQLIDGLHAMASFLESHSEIGKAGEVRLDFWNAKLPEVLALGLGKLDKAVLGSLFIFRKKFGPMVSIDWNAQRTDVCKRVVTGTRIFEKPVMQQVGTETVTEEIVEWQCPDSILKAARESNGPGETEPLL